MNKYTERKEPTFGQPHTATTSEEKRAESPLHSQPNAGFSFTPVETVEEQDTQTAEKTTTSPQHAEPIVNVNTPSGETAFSSPKAERVLVDTPSKEEIESPLSKYRRVIFVAIALLALLSIFFLMKPKSPTDDAKAQTQEALPIEFRPIDAEEAKRAEEERQRQQAERQAQEALAQQTATAHPEAEKAGEAEQNVEPAASVTESASVAPEDNAQGEPVDPVVSQPDTTQSVIHQAETPTTAAKPVQQTTTQPVKTLKPLTANPPKSETKPQTQVVKTVTKPVEKVVKTEPKAEAKPASTTPASSTAIGSKTITVQKGVSLFQHFRDNGLEGNLPELNKMTKVNNATSHLQPGQKIVVRLDKNHRITEMRIGSGKYIRQADGSYLYK